MANIVKPQTPRTNWNNRITDGLLMDIPFFEKGGSPLDIVRNLKATLVNTPTYTVGALGPAMTFTTNQAVKFTTSTYYNTSYGRTLEIWFKSNGAQNAPANLVKKDNAFIMRLNDSGNFRWIPFGGGSIPITYNGVTYTTGKWFQLIGTQRPNLQVMYLNGTRVASATNVNSPDNSVSDIGIGAAPDGSEPSNTDIAIVRYWKRELQPSEIASLYADPGQLYLPANYPIYANSIAVVSGQALMMGSARLAMGF